jgi:hypothetical protein
VRTAIVVSVHYPIFWASIAQLAAMWLHFYNAQLDIYYDTNNLSQHNDVGFP